MCEPQENILRATAATDRSFDPRSLLLCMLVGSNGTNLDTFSGPSR